jgi:Cytochrome P460
LFVAVPFAAVAIAQSGAETPAISSELESLLHVPAANYRQEWVLLGSFSVRADDPEKGAKELHVVYAEPKTVEVYRETGAFPDGAVLVKDVFATKTEALTTGIASYADTLKGRFVMVKDKAGKNSDESPLWGDGWGWAFYEVTETQKTVTTDYRKDCLGCHEPVRSQDLA